MAFSHRNGVILHVRLMTLAILVAALLASVGTRADEPSTEGNSSPPGHDETTLVTKEITGSFTPRFKPDFTAVAAAVIKQTNEFRKIEKLGVLARDETLDKTAQLFAEYMARTGEYGHSADERTPVQRATAAGYELCYLGENIAMLFKGDGYATGPLAKALFQGWKNSPPHRANMLNRAVTQTGFGIAQSAETGAYFAVQLVGRPLSQAIDFQVRNETDLEVQYQLDTEKFTLPSGYTREHRLCAPAVLKVMQQEQEVTSVSPETGHLYVIRSTSDGMRIEKNLIPVEAIKP